MYDAAGYTQANAIFYTATYGQGFRPCTLTVSGLGGGSFRVSDALYYNALYVQPRSFGVLFAAGNEPNFSQQYQIYDVDSGTTALTTNSSTLVYSDRRTLLPTTNTILAHGLVTFSTTTGVPGAETFAVASQAWTVAAPPSTDREGSGLVTLFDGTALAVGGTAAPYMTPLVSSEIYEDNSWTLTGPLSTPRDQVRTLADCLHRVL